MKILLLGKNGQVGNELRRTLLPFGEVVALGSKEANFSCSATIQQVLHTHKPTVIVNAAAYTAVDQAESDEASADQVNAKAVALLASHAKNTNALLVHYSTDYVFDGEKPGAYSETDPTNPQSAYGRTKRAGEEAILDSGCKALLFRTSWVFSAYGNNFVKTIIRLAKQRDSLGIVADQIGAPTCAELIADVTALAIAAYHKNTIPLGLYHLTAAGQTSWHGLASHVVSRLQANNIDLKASVETIKPIATSDYPLPAKRPKNSRLDTSKLNTALGLQLPHWTLHVDRTIDQLITYTEK